MANLFHFLSIIHTWTDCATSGAIDHHELWIFFCIHRSMPMIYTFCFYPCKLTEKK